jgi:anti-sigma B factor antagonist
MEISEHIEQDIYVVSLSGRLKGCPEADALYETFKKIRERGVNRVVINLKDLEWMGSMGLGAFIGCLTSMRNVDGDMRLANPNEKVANLLHITRLDSVFNVYDTLDHAKKSFETYK